MPPPPRRTNASASPTPSTSTSTSASTNRASPTSAHTPSSTARAHWTAELDTALVTAYLDQTRSLADSPRRSISWPSIARSIRIPSSGNHEDERELCDSLRHRIKRLRQYAAQIHQLLAHPSQLFFFDHPTACVLPAPSTGLAPETAWRSIGNLTLRHRLRHSTFPWYPSLAPHLDEDDLRMAPSTCLCVPPLMPAATPLSPRSVTTVGSPVGSTSLASAQEKGHDQEQEQEQEQGRGRKRRTTTASSASLPATLTDDLPTPADEKEAELSPSPSKRLRTSAESAESPDRERESEDVDAGGKRAWTTERDVTLVECYMDSLTASGSDSFAPAPAPGGSVWRRVVRAVFGPSLAVSEEREVGDSARHRLKKLKGYAAQIHQLLKTTDQLFVWDSARSCLRVNTSLGHNEEGTWAKIRNPQVRNRLIRAHYPWLKRLRVSDGDLPPTFYTTTLGHEYFSTSRAASHAAGAAAAPAPAPAHAPMPMPAQGPMMPAPMPHHAHSQPSPPTPRSVYAPCSSPYYYPVDYYPVPAPYAPPHSPVPVYFVPVEPPRPASWNRLPPLVWEGRSGVSTDPSHHAVVPHPAPARMRAPEWRSLSPPSWSSWSAVEDKARTRSHHGPVLPPLRALDTGRTHRAFHRSRPM